MTTVNCFFLALALHGIDQLIKKPKRSQQEKVSIDKNRFSNKFYWQLKVVLLSTCNYQATDYKTLIALFKATSRRLCPGVPVHRGNNHCTPFFTNFCLSVEHCWFFFIGSCEQVHEDRTVPALYAGRI